MRQLHIKEYGKGFISALANDWSREIKHEYPALKRKTISAIISYGHAITLEECYHTIYKDLPTGIIELEQATHLHRRMGLMAKAATMNCLIETNPELYLMFKAINK